MNRQAKFISIILACVFFWWCFCVFKVITTRDEYKATLDNSPVSLAKVQITYTDKTKEEFVWYRYFTFDDENTRFYSYDEYGNFLRDISIKNTSISKIEIVDPSFVQIKAKDFRQRNSDNV